MSLVEKALKKIRDAYVESAGAPVVVGSVVDASAALAAEVASRQQSRTLRSRQSKKLIIVDQDALRVAGFLPPLESRHRLANEYRQIKRPLIANAFGKGVDRLPRGRIMMIASALPGEGKTFTSVNLSLNMALEKDLNVLLIDADLAKPHISHTFDVAREPGLVDILSDASLDPESAVISTNIERLSILPAGRRVETATELLASTRMEEIVESLSAADPHRIVIFDSPPLLLTNESRVLASVVGQSVIVVRAGVTPRSAVMEALEFLGIDATVNLVLNQSENETPANYYGYGEYGMALKNPEEREVT